MRWIGLIGLSLAASGCHLIFPHSSSDRPRGDSAGEGAVDRYVPRPDQAGDAVQADRLVRDGPSPCGAAHPCPGGEFCELQDCFATEGDCVDVPQNCQLVYQPVCGCDGKTHSNDCFRRAAGVSLSHPGACLPGTDGGPSGDLGCAGCFSGKGCVAGNTAAECGKGGAPCADCASLGMSCSVAGVCLPLPCASCAAGQCCAAGVCMTSGDLSCGRTGESCVPCLAGSTCVGGRCIPDTCSGTCAGCCEVTGCFNKSENNSLHCGNKGESCVSCPAGTQCLAGKCS